MTEQTGGGQSGQAAVELALALPLVALLLLCAVQVGLVTRDQVLLTHAAREAAREAAVNPSPEAVRRAALAGAPLTTERLQVAVAAGPASTSGARVSVQVTYRSATRVPLVGPLLPEVTLEGRASMRSEV